MVAEPANGLRFGPLPTAFRLEHHPPRSWWILRAGFSVPADRRIWESWIRGEGGDEIVVRGGRAPARLISLEPGQGVLRHTRHGGALRALRGDRFWGAGRFLAELHASEALRAAGVPTPELLGICLKTTAGPCLRGWVISRYIGGGANLRDWVHDRFGDPQERARVLRLCARGVSAMHAAGCSHRDLNLANLLLAGETVYILDLDGARIRTALSVRERCANLLRLYRSLAKETGRTEPLLRGDRLLFLKSYGEGNPELIREAWRFLSRRWDAAGFRRRLSRTFRGRSASPHPGGPGTPPRLPQR
jgi:tRNA A-37 threonylcarbamoyl transferase component Bud32